MKSIVLLSGPVGAGKSTVARELINLSTGAISYIEGDTFWSFLAKGSGTSIHKNFMMIMTSMVTAALPYAIYGYETIIDFSIPPWFLGTAIKIAKRKSIPLHYVVLRPGEVVCAHRAANRAEGAIEDYSRYHELYTSFDEAQQYIIPDEVNTPAFIAGLIREGLNEGVFLVI